MRIFRFLFQGLLKIIFKIAFRLNPNRVFNKNNIVVPNEPVVFLCNHQNNFDAIRLRIMNNRRIAFVAHDELYRNKFYKWIANNLLDSICRGKTKNDISFIKNIFEAKKKGLSIGIYPEGGINYFNKSIPFDTSTAKLCKKLNLPIILVTVNGGSFLTPRWAKHKAHGKLEYTYQKLITKDELEKLSVENLDMILKKYLYINDYDWQRKNLIEFKRKNRAETLDKALFICPNCFGYHGISCKNNLILCSRCHSTFILDKYDFIQSNSNITDLVQWDKFQYSKLLSDIPCLQDNHVLLKAENVTFNSCDATKHFSKKNLQICNIYLYKKHLILKTRYSEDILSIESISKIYVEFKNTIQFNCNNLKYRISHKNIPAYVWVSYFRALNQYLKEKEA